MKQSIKEPGGFLVDAKTAFTGESAASKKTGTKKRWFVVEDNLLYYYASKTVRHSFSRPPLRRSATLTHRL